MQPDEPSPNIFGAAEQAICLSCRVQDPKVCNAAPMYILKGRKSLACKIGA